MTSELSRPSDRSQPGESCIRCKVFVPFGSPRFCLPNGTICVDCRYVLGPDWLTALSNLSLDSKHTA